MLSGMIKGIVEKIKKSEKINKRNIIYFSFFTLTIGICIGLFIYSQNVYDVNVIYGNTDTTLGFPIEKDMVISQEFEAENLVGAGVNFDEIEDITDVPDVDVEISLFDAESETLLTSIEFNAIRGGVGPKVIKIPAENKHISENHKYRLEVKQISESKDKKIAVLTEQRPSASDMNKMSINGVEQRAKLSVTALIKAEVSFIPVFSVLLIGVVMAAVYMLQRSFEIEKIFVVLFLGLGMIYSLLMSPFVIPDEATHYDRAYSLSNRFTGYEDTMRREEDLSLFTYLHTPDKHTVQETLDHLFTLSSSNKMVQGDVIHSRYVKTIPYIAPSIGITIGKFLHLGAYPMFYLGRIFNLLLTAVMLYFAIKLIPFGKVMVFVISFLPMTMHLVGSYSYDGLTIGSVTLFISYVLYLKYEKQKLEVKDCAVLTGLPMLFLSAKSFGYMPVLLLLILLPWKKTYKENKKMTITFAITASILFLYISGAFSLIQSFLAPAAVSNSAADTVSSEIITHSYADVLRSPIKYVIMVLGTLYRNIGAYILDMVGSSLCWFTFPVKKMFVCLYLLLMLFVGLNYEENKVMKPLDRAVIGFTGIITTGVVVLSMAIAYTPASMNTIIGIQGRYFIPIIMLLFLAIYNFRIHLNKNIDTFVLYSVVVLQILTIMDILLNIMRI